MKTIPTIFGDILSRNVVYAVDTSGSMYSSLPTVKDHLIEYLNSRLHQFPDSRFNILEFSTYVTQWTDRMVQNSKAAVGAATNWIQNLSAKTGTNTLDALLTAYGDPGCDAVVLVTDGLPDQRPEEILDHVSYAAHGRPVHAIYLAHSETDTIATEFLHRLAYETGGSFRIVSITKHGHIERITPVYESKYGVAYAEAKQRSQYPDTKTCSVDATMNNIPQTLGEQIILAERPCTLWPYKYGNFINGYPIGWSR